MALAIQQHHERIAAYLRQKLGTHASLADVVALGRVLAIGDSVRTDLKGAAGFGIDSVFVTSGIHAEEYGGRHTPDIEALDGIFAAGGVTPIAVTRGLKW